VYDIMFASPPFMDFSERDVVYASRSLPRYRA
jgi:hypothetical protein